MVSGKLPSNIWNTKVRISSSSNLVTSYPEKLLLFTWFAQVDKIKYINTSVSINLGYQGNVWSSVTKHDRKRQNLIDCVDNNPRGLCDPRIYKASMVVSSQGRRQTLDTMKPVLRFLHKHWLQEQLKRPICPPQRRQAVLVWWLNHWKGGKYENSPDTA